VTRGFRRAGYRPAPGAPHSGTPASARAFLALLFATCVALPGPAAVAAGCQTELQVLAADLQGADLTQRQIQDVASLLIEARRYCWVHQESVAMGLINRARGAAGLGPSSGEFDWENVPLDSLRESN
jgi:hypothetical protein